MPAPRAERDSTRQRIQATVDCVPAGRVATYGQIAHEAGLPRRSRLVGRVLRELPRGSTLAWHRVVDASGRIAARGNPEAEGLQRRRLKREGVRFDERGRIDLQRFGWDPEA